MAAKGKGRRGEKRTTVAKIDRELTPQRGERVSFEVLCRPRSGAGLPELSNEMTLETLERSSPDERTMAGVAKQLQSQGFTVFVDDESTSVSAEGPFELVEKVFQTGLRKRERTLRSGNRDQTFEFFDTRSDAPDLNVGAVPGALYAAIQRPPIFLQSPLPPPVKYFHLAVPGDVAMLTNASATHRRSTPTGDRATGSGVRVAMLDTGFSMHPYHVRHGYRLNPVLAADATGPASLDPHGHGTGEVANIFACAPDAQVIGVKMGANPVLSFDKAMAFAPKVISNSWAFHLPGVTTVPPALVPLRLKILSIVASGVTVVFSAGNGHIGFPSMMPEVIAVGGAFADNNGALKASDYSSSFTSLIFPGRNVPDFCGLVGMKPKASYIMLPIPKGCVIDTSGGGVPFPDKDETTTTDGWGVFSGTSAAAPQVAGICALLLQKKPALTPNQIKTILRGTAVDVTTGFTNSGPPADVAVVGPDRATGTGLVNALAAWLVA